MSRRSSLSAGRITVKRLFGEPYEKNGLTIIPAARVRGGAGGGGGEGPEGQGKGSGTGFGVSARPVGTYAIRGDEVTWRPAVDVIEIIVRAQVVMIVALPHPPNDREGTSQGSSGGGPADRAAEVERGPLINRAAS